MYLKQPTHSERERFVLLEDNSFQAGKQREFLLGSTEKRRKKGPGGGGEGGSGWDGTKNTNRNVAKSIFSMRGVGEYDD